MKSLMTLLEKDVRLLRSKTPIIQGFFFFKNRLLSNKKKELPLIYIVQMKQSYLFKYSPHALKKQRQNL